MKKIFTRAAMLLAVVAMASAFTACDDGDDGGKKKFESELIGSYQPTPVTLTIPDVVEEPSPFYFLLLPTWTDPDNIPGIDLSESMGMPAGSWIMPMNTICGLIQAMASNIVKGGLVQVDLKDDGSFGARYHGLIIGDDVISSIMDPKFTPEISSFPSAETAELLPEGALGYYTKDSHFYFTISKAFLKQVGETSEMGDLTSIIDGLLAAYKLDIVSTDEYYAIPLKYSVKDGVTKLYVDRAMIMPFLPLLEELFKLLGDEASFMGISLGDIVTTVLNNTTELEFALPLQRL